MHGRVEIGTWIYALIRAALQGDSAEMPKHSIYDRTTNREDEGAPPRILHEAISKRHSTRLFLPKPLPDEDLRAALQAAALAPSEYNAQKWKTYVVTGDALDRLKAGLKAAALAGPPASEADLAPCLRESRSVLGKVVYGLGWKIPRGDLAARQEAAMRNYDFFGAPVGIILCVHNRQPGVEALSIGMYLQTLVLALTDHGIASCVQVAIAEYPEAVRAPLGIPEELDILVGVSVDYEDPEAHVNSLKVGRLPLEETTVFVND
ncbi:Nitroreductase-like protein [Coniochaeta sp. 2T2.1]|nr:Nitroreductase-like protein [Coniochaeta sp. 2T2.1]